MKKIINYFLGKIGYRVVKSSTYNTIKSNPNINTIYQKQQPLYKNSSENNGKFSWVNEYLEWTNNVFGKPIYPILDAGTKINASFKEGDKFFNLASIGLIESENLIYQNLLDELKHREVPGALVEFGVFEGAWINKLYEYSERIGLHREIWGFDSFQGLSKPHPNKDIAFWKEGMFTAGVELVRKNVKAIERPRIKLIQGWFSDSLNETKAQSLESISYARIDCDIYQPTTECLTYLSSRLSHGSILVFDDWSHNHTFGETRAFAEWVPTVPNLEFEFLFYGFWDHFYVRVWHRGLEKW